MTPSEGASRARDRDFRGLRVTVMGLGSFGGGLGAVQFMVRRGARVTVTDLRTAEQLQTPLAALAETPPEALHLGGHRPDDFSTCDLLVVSPAVPKESPHLAAAVAAGVPTTSEMNLFWELCPGRLVGVTGSNGKSTTTALTHALLAGDGRRCWLGGNIGRSLLPVVDEIQPGDWVVLELSSFQLDDLAALDRGADAAIVTNFSPNHLDRHGTLAAYRAAKQTLLKKQPATALTVLNQDDADVAAWPGGGRRLWFGLADSGAEGAFAVGDEAVLRIDGRETRLPLADWCGLPGIHNRQNALAAIACAAGLGASLGAVEQGLRGFKALPHRLEFVTERAGRRFYNDSLATTPESAECALRAFTQPIVLLAGGYDKHADLSAFVRTLTETPVKAVALLGTTGPALGRLLDQFPGNERIARHVCASFEEAFAWSVALTSPGDVVLLSPACASYDWFQNFAERGERFRRLALAWPGPTD